ncbi:MAG TPA: hypothetical protein VF221_01765 [Chloroflexota bacterium]
MVVRPAVDGDWPKAEPLLRAFGGVPGGVAARLGAVARLRYKRHLIQACIQQTSYL